jgi:hypothetical protein
MGLMDEGLLQFWRILNKNEVQYIMAGDFAMTLHCKATRITPYLELFLRDEIENRKRLQHAFYELNYNDYPFLENMQLDSDLITFNLGDGIIVDIMTSMKGIENLTFEECYKLAFIALLEDVEVPFLHLNHLLANKKAVNRPKDQLDVLELEKIKALQQKTQASKGS